MYKKTIHIPYKMNGRINIIAQRRHVLPIDKLTAINYVPFPGLGDALVATPIFAAAKHFNPSIQTRFFVKDSYISILSQPHIDNIIGVKFHPYPEKITLNEWIQNAYNTVYSICRQHISRSSHELLIIQYSMRDIHADATLKKFKTEFPLLRIITAPGGTANAQYLVTGEEDDIVVGPMLTADRQRRFYRGYGLGLNFLSPMLGNAAIETDLDHIRPVINPTLLSPDRISSIRQKLLVHSILLDKPLIFINPFSTAQERNLYNPEQFAIFANTIAQFGWGRHRVMINGGAPGHTYQDGTTAQDYHRATLELAERLGQKKLLYIAPRLEIEEIPGILKLCAGLITVDTSILHISADPHFTDMPTVGYFFIQGYTDLAMLQTDKRHLLLHEYSDIVSNETVMHYALKALTALNIR